jgi:hypothetical protein
MNAAIQGTSVHDLRIAVEGETALPWFLRFIPPKNVHTDRFAGYKNVNAHVNMKADADGKTLRT